MKSDIFCSDLVTTQVGNTSRQTVNSPQIKLYEKNIVKSS